MAEFENHYGRLYSTSEPVPPEYNDAHDNPGDSKEWYIEYISNEETATAIRRMKRHKAVGPDRIAVDFLKDNEILIPLITRIFNKSFDSGRIPNSWRTAHVKPLFKVKGSAEDANNYRCISLAPHIYKAFTSTLTSRSKLYMNHTQIEYVTSFKYLGITMQPALGFSEHVTHLLTRTATATITLGDLQKIPLTLAMKIYTMKIILIIRYGMSKIAPNRSKTTMIDLDKSKTIFLKATLGLSKYTSNTLGLALTGEKTLGEDLSEMGYKFDDTAWNEYRESLTIERTKYPNENFTTGPAFTGKTWKNANQKNRAYICRITYHGYHHNICHGADFFETTNDLCTCKYCASKGIDRHHISNCIYFQGKTISSIIREISNHCG